MELTPQKTSHHGFFAIPRDLYESIKIEHGLKGYGITVAVLNELAARVRYSGNIGNNLEIGQCYMGRDEMALILGTTSSKIRSSLQVLTKLGVILTKTQPKNRQEGTKLTILDKRIFSQLSPRNDQETTKNSPQTDFPTTTTKGKKKILWEPKQGEKDLLCNVYRLTKEQLELEIASARAYVDDPVQNKRKRTWCLSFLKNWVRRGALNPKTPEELELEKIKATMFAPHPTQKNWE